MKMPTTTNLYNTKDTLLAAWLRTQGFKITHIDDDTQPCRFFFDDTLALREEIRQWDLMEGNAGVVQICHSNYRDLLRKIHPKVGRL